jgi:hypothetical protein
MRRKPGKSEPRVRSIGTPVQAKYLLGKVVKALNRACVLADTFDPIEVQQPANCLTRKRQLLQESKGRMADLEEMVVARTAQMVQEREKFKAIFDNSPEGIFQITGDGRFNRSPGRPEPVQEECQAPANP